ncbi:MAG: BlaI/MecI/CopY family transcriptional regulator [Firmicutes bacterium]|nr:BlaI/MecI/CopY family transcriptional regulator [Bacillota bacterium]
MKLYDSELKVMEVLWQNGDRTAKEIVDVLRAQVGWNKNTTYTVIKKCIAKEAIERKEPGFLCHALIEKEQIQKEEVCELLNKVFDGSIDILFASLLSSSPITEEDREKLYKLLEEKRP